MILLAAAPPLNLYASADPWAQIRERYKQTPAVDKAIAKNTFDDPWQALRSVFLPFSLEEERQAVVSRPHAKRFSKKFDAALKPYGYIIQRASDLFDIPPAIISAVIMAESAGNPNAAAGITSAKGLMQTIDATFAMARSGLKEMGITIKNDPFDPEASILAGTWYLNRMFERAVRDGRVKGGSDRSSVASWRYPLEYYYAGPGHGAKPENKIMVFSRGQRRIIDKRAYSEKIQTWAQILNTKERST
ncbi:MAG: transglycosylase SLT domain-containing protein [Desulfobacterales bacterium]|nr:transglycosylase SLT domain-containing protein [Desulfobacterales bacterium]